ncbi:hypothetical protein [Cupriavidus malaysiensis]|uniref:Uncharacterized protein n=1 Tax=Cupriavidus malaysiensis TaxID=367825 RepID=A0ABM6FGT9_9BURK|nr:hypothetical protein [Cupriavidus malaysiensis]AOZ11169.1 hypothetical protein BKK80_35035 [Cupriavidus malaysiensis]
MQGTGYVDLTPHDERLVLAFDAPPARRCRTAVIQAFFRSPKARRVLRAACWRRLRSFERFEDIQQEIGLTLVAKTIGEPVVAAEIWLHLYNLASNLCLSMQRKRAEVSLDALLIHTSGYDDSSWADASKEALLLGDSAAKAEHDTVDEKRACQAAERIYQASVGSDDPCGMFENPGLIFGDEARIQVQRLVQSAIAGEPAADTGRSLMATSADKQKLTPSPEGLELNAIRKELGHSIKDFASLLNIKPGRLTSFFYGVVKVVDPAVLAEARALKAEGVNEAQRMQERYRAATMRELTDQWIKRLADSGIDAPLDAVIQINRATLWRWREENMRPSMRMLENYERRLDAFIQDATR